MHNQYKQEILTEQENKLAAEIRQYIVRFLHLKETRQ